MDKLRIIFMGTPEFGVPVLQALITQHDVVAVYTRTDKPAGRGKQIAESPVKLFAREHNLSLEQPRTLRNMGEQNRLQ